ncbi:MAG TPA: GNAT family N-acetyltransferase [Anaeromyxobacteraceae bacterium]|nr:GNAT family N-acetyltransferase [Anaeromyxobacteraceae bacterium]
MLALRVVDSITKISAAAWDALVDDIGSSPFVRHAFLGALERSRCASPRNDWQPSHLALFRGSELVAAAPAYVKGDSDGDFSRDWEWVAAAQRAGLRLHPKLVVTVPFTPVAGARLLVRGDQDRAEAVEALARGARSVAADLRLGSVEVLYARASDVSELEAHGFLPRADFQYHWRNEGYREPEDFLARFPSKKRNALRRERAAPERQGISIRTVRGDELARDPDGWADVCFELHDASTSRMAWGMRWVNRAFYRDVLRGMPERIEVVEARREGRVVAMAFNLATPARLYGRYWGAREEHPFLHFNVALYHSIDECIRRGVAAFEGGAGGEHKLARGFMPAFTYGAHWFADRRLHAGMQRVLAEEWRQRESALRRFEEASPIFKRS